MPSKDYFCIEEEIFYLLKADVSRTTEVLHEMSLDFESTSGSTCHRHRNNLIKRSFKHQLQNLLSHVE
jgi:hypothetical protein